MINIVVVKCEYSEEKKTTFFALSFIDLCCGFTVPPWNCGNRTKQPPALPVDEPIYKPVSGVKSGFVFFSLAEVMKVVVELKH